MEPASTVATMALAATTILPQIEVTLRNWDNRTGRVVNCYYTEENPHSKQIKKPPFAHLVHGACHTDEVIALTQGKRNFLTTTMLMTVDFRDCLHVIFTHFQNPYAHFSHNNTNDYLQISFETLDRLTLRRRLFDEIFTWESNNPPRHISFEIDGTIPADGMDFSQIVVHREDSPDKLK